MTGGQHPYNPPLRRSCFQPAARFVAIPCPHGISILPGRRQAYALYAVLNLPVPVEAQKQAAEKMSFCSRMKEMVQPTIIDWDAEADQGATALNFLSIKRKQAPRPGQDRGGCSHSPTLEGGSWRETCQVNLAARSPGSSGDTVSGG